MQTKKDNLVTAKMKIITKTEYNEVIRVQEDTVYFQIIKE